ncbi:MAG: MBL fold metallo-hydrolase [candidate division WOR-3 bacterium]|nr:MAG: MBL fold metallo-hydrolase [candidate division WOR-3 bacterium]
MGRARCCYRLGEFELYPVSDGFFWLDGGSMFGIVPKVLWSKLTSADRRNRVRLALNCLLVKSKDKNILIDTGMGDKLSKKMKEIYKVEREANLLRSLARLGVAPPDVDYVINTHLHFDHCGGNTTKSDGKFVPTFPNARYVIQRQEWFNAQNPKENTKSSYREKDFAPIEDAGQVMFVDGDHDVVPGVTVLLTNGHTLGHQSVMISTKRGRALYLGDVIPTSHHLKAQYLTGFDLYPVDLVNRKKEIVDRALKEKWLLIFEHDPAIVFAYLAEKDGKRTLKPLEV